MKVLPKALLAADVALSVAGAHAQGTRSPTPTPNTDSGTRSSMNAVGSASRSGTESSMLPWPGGYVGFGVGRSKFESDCSSGFACESRDTGYKLFMGGRLHEMVSLEVGYIDFGKVSRDGGSLNAHGATLSLVGSLPVAEGISLIGRVGTTYASTNRSAAVGSTGSENGFGVHYGAGVGFSLTRTVQLVAEWERHQVAFRDSSRDLDIYGVGMRFRF